MAQQRVLITGKNGNLGQQLIRRFDSHALYDVTATGRHELDLAWEPHRIKEFLDVLQPDVIINAAGFTAVDQAESQFEEALAANAKGPQVLAEWIDNRQGYFVHISTDYVFDGLKGERYTPLDETHPVNRYGLSKLAGEVAILEASAKYSVVIRTSWLFGPAGKNFVPFVIQAALENRPVNIAHDQWGTPTWAGSLCDMIHDVLVQRPHGILHGCNHGEVSRYDQALFICNVMGVDPGFMTPVTTESFNFPAKRPQNSALESSFLAAPFWQEATEKYLLSQTIAGLHV